MRRSGSGDFCDRLVKALLAITSGVACFGPRKPNLVVSLSPACAKHSSFSETCRMIERWLPMHVHVTRGTSYGDGFGPVVVAEICSNYVVVVYSQSQEVALACLKFGVNTPRAAQLVAFASSQAQSKTRTLKPMRFAMNTFLGSCCACLNKKCSSCVYNAGLCRCLGELGCVCWPCCWARLTLLTSA